MHACTDYVLVSSHLCFSLRTARFDLKVFNHEQDAIEFVMIFNEAIPVNKEDSSMYNYLGCRHNFQRGLGIMSCMYMYV